MPVCPEKERGLQVLLDWCRARKSSPLIFGCEETDRQALEQWELTEIGRQPLFWAHSDYSAHHSGPDQPASHRELRRQARRSSSKNTVVRELSTAKLWELTESGALDGLLTQRWYRRGLADFSFLVELRLSRGNERRRAFLASHSESGEIRGLALLVPCQRGWLMEHHLVSKGAPNGTGELLLCEILSQHLSPGECLSLGITPLFREMMEIPAQEDVPSILQGLPLNVKRLLLKSWERFYGFQSLLQYRKKLEPEVWEPVYWAVPERRQLTDTFSVLKTFAGGSFVSFAWATLDKWLHRFALGLRRGFLPAVNLFYIVTLLLWLPILWNLDGEQLFGHALACKVWAIYDFFLWILFVLHQDVVRTCRRSNLTGLLLGLVTADTVLAWLQTALYHGGLPSTQPLGSVIFLINTAPISALLFLILVNYTCKALPFENRDKSGP